MGKRSKRQPTKAGVAITQTNVSSRPSPTPANRWQKFSVAIAVVAVLVVVGLKFRDEWRIPDVRLVAFSPGSIVDHNQIRFDDHVQFNFSEGNLSAPKELAIGLENVGSTRAEQIALTIVFSDTLKVDATKLGLGWKFDPQLTNAYIYDDPKLVLHPAPSDGKLLAPFIIRVPPTTGRRLLAIYDLHGNFSRTAGLLYWDSVQKRYIVEHNNTTNISAVFDTWNKNVMQERGTLAGGGLK